MPGGCLPAAWIQAVQAVSGFAQFTERVGRQSDILHPWRQLGRKWHVARRGFPLGKKVRWEVDVLERLFRLLERAAPDGQFQWTNKQVVPLSVAGQKEPWAAVQTKKLDAVYLTLTGPKGRFTLGQITGLGHDPDLDAQRPDVDLLRLKFRSRQDLARGNLAALLKKHLAEVKKGG